MKVALFPGQGSQYAGMAKALLDAFPWAREIYEEASDAVRENLLKLCLEGPDDKLTLTENAQPCILTTSYAWFQVLRRECDFAPQAGAGHSLGEYTALLAAGAMTLAEAAPLVRTRGRLMQTAVPAGKGKMAAVIGLADDQVRALCQAATERDSLVVPANFNAPSQVVVAGHAEAVDRAQALAADKAGPFPAKRFLPLNVSAPFHSPLMAPVAEKFLPSLKAVKWQPLKFPVRFNVDAELRKEADCADLLRRQVDHPVLWSQSMAAFGKEGHRSFVEPGPGKVLTGLLKRILPEAKCLSVESADGVRELQAEN